MTKWLLLASLMMTVSSPAEVQVRVVFGQGDAVDVVWDGSVKATGAQITGIAPWRFEGTDAVTSTTSWKASIHSVRRFGGRGLFGATSDVPAVANGILVALANETPEAEIAFTTAQGNFTIRLADIPYGARVRVVNNRVMVDRVPASRQLTSSNEEQDYPAAAVDKSGTVWVAYLEFRHHPDHEKIRANMREPRTDFSMYQTAPLGDQILLRKLDSSEPIAITEPGGDTYRPAVAVDGKGVVWVFWSQNEKGNFDVWARPVENGKAGRAVRISRDPGTDMDCVAATDSKGNVHVAWQGWRNGKASIFASAQNGAAFSAPAAVSTSSANEWDPAIAADSAGRVSVVWDSYRNGQYDVFARTATNGVWGREFPVAASARYEAYPSAAYDPSGRLWIAYEEGAERWGKDFGAYNSEGVALYQGRAIRVKAFDKDGNVRVTKTDVGAALPGNPVPRVDVPSRQLTDGEGWLKPDPKAATDRVDARDSRQAIAPRNTTPRVAVDASGRVWVAFRSASPTWWNPIGTVWTEHLATYASGEWAGPIFLDHTDNLLDNRPAIVSTKAGSVTIVGSSDGRRQFVRIERSATDTGMDASVAKDPYNNDLFVNTVEMAPAATVLVDTAPKPVIAGATSKEKAEDATVATLRSYRTSQGLRIIRGEFHRHSEVSMDGGRDGSIIDQYRYMIDTAGMDWVGCCDHDNGGGREYSWWISQKLTDLFHAPGKFTTMFSYERSVSYPEGHRNVVFAQRGVRTLPRLLPLSAPDKFAKAPDTEMLYGYLKKFGGIVASHTSGTLMGTDWRNNDPNYEPVVEIYQGDRQNYEMPGAPRTNIEKDSIGGWRPKGFVNLALEMGYKLGFQASSDHVSTHMSYANLLVKEPTREGLMDAFRKRHIYGSTGDLLADVRSGTYMMGDVFSTKTAPTLQVKLVGTAAFAKVVIIKDGKYVYTSEPKTSKVDFTWRDTAPDKGKQSYYYVRGEQADGEIVWASPMWITYTGQ